MSTIQFIDGGGPIEVDYMGLTDYSPFTTSHSLAASYGDAVSSRRIVHAFHVGALPGVTPTFASTPTIGGVTASVLKTTYYVDGGAVQATRGVVWLGADNVPGTTGNLVAVFNQNVSVRAATFRLLNVQSFTLIDEAQITWAFDSATSKVLSIDALDGGAVLAAADVIHSDASPTLSGVTQDYSQDPTISGGPYRMAGGHGEISGDQAGLPVTLNRTTSDTWNGAFSAISLR